MKLAFLNACYMNRDLNWTAQWAAQNGFDSVELHGGPRYTFINWEAVAAGEVEPVLSPFQRHGVGLAGIMFGALPFVDPDPEVRRKAHTYLKTLIRAAKALGIPVVSTFTGRDGSKPARENVDLVVEAFGPLAAFAEEQGIKLAFENCPMVHIYPHGINMAYSPDMWSEVFERVGSPALGLNFDPSHLLWQEIDYVEAAREFASRIWIVQAKDTEVLPEVLKRVGIRGEGWWRHRVPGQGGVDWNRLFAVLKEVGYDGVVSIEHEDPLWEGTEEKVEEGLRLGRDFLRKFIPTEGRA